MSNKFEPILEQIKNQLETARGEIYNFLNSNRKKSATAARACFLNIRKACTQGRNELQDMKVKLPVRRRNLSDATKAKMAASRAARKAAKEAKSASKVAK